MLQWEFLIVFIKQLVCHRDNGIKHLLIRNKLDWEMAKVIVHILEV
jgi:hypothetical protein